MVNIPERIGRYQVRGVLGSGGFATVYRAYDASLERELALKVLHPHLATDPALRERFLREGRALARVEHPNIVTVWEAGEDGGTAYLAMKLIAGRPLADILAMSGPLPAGQVATIIEQVAAALGEVHARHLVHRDIKPENIMIEEGSNRAMLLDLGVARDLANATMTGGLIVGTLGYMAPEQAQASGEVTPRTDVYQLGATAFALLTGRPPFGGDTIQVLDAIIRQPPPDLRLLRPDLPPGVVAAVARALAKDARYRYPTTRDFASDLRAAVTPQPFMPPAATSEAGAPPVQAPPPFQAPRAAEHAMWNSAPGHGAPSSPQFPHPSMTPHPGAAPGSTWVAGQLQPQSIDGAGSAWYGGSAPLPGAPPWAQPAATPYAEIWRRAVAETVDWLLCFFAVLILSALWEGITGGTDSSLDDWLGLLTWFGGIGFYFAYLESRPRGATLGKMLTGIAVRDLAGRPISPAQAAGRYAAKYLSMLILLIGYLMALGDPHRRALHDRLAGTVVVPWRP